MATQKPRRAIEAEYQQGHPLPRLERCNRWYHIVLLAWAIWTLGMLCVDLSGVPQYTQPYKERWECLCDRHIPIAALASVAKLFGDVKLYAHLAFQFLLQYADNLLAKLRNAEPVGRSMRGGLFGSKKNTNGSIASRSGQESWTDSALEKQPLETEPFPPQEAQSDSADS